MKRLFIFTLLAFTGMGLWAQNLGDTVFNPDKAYFDWAKSFSGKEYTEYDRNLIVDAVIDSLGNLYVAGEFSRDASFDGKGMLPFSPYGGYLNNRNVCIMKISAGGDVVWQKILHSNYNHDARVFDMQLVGDTALYVNAAVFVPIKDNEYLYFYDTLLTKTDLDYLLDSAAFTCSQRTTMISVFDLNGNLTENHLLHMAYKDIYGDFITRDLVTRCPAEAVHIADQPFNLGRMHVDRQGNIYFAHRAFVSLGIFYHNQFGSYNLGDGMFGEMVVMDNGRLRFVDSLPSNPTGSNFRVMKFSPHMKDMVACKYIFDDHDSAWPQIMNYTGFELTTDGDDNLLLQCNASSQHPFDLRLADDTSITAHSYYMENGMVIKFDDKVMPLYLMQLNMDDISLRDNLFTDCFVEPDSNSIIILGSTNYSTLSPWTPIIYRQDTLDLADNCAYFLRIDSETGNLLSYGYIPSAGGSAYWTESTDYRLQAVAKDNKIFSQVHYKDGIQIPGDSLSVLPTGSGVGLYICDYEGNFIDFIDYGGGSGTSTFLSGCLALRDSVMYITGGMCHAVTLGDTTLTPEYYSIAYMGRYVDSSFRDLSTVGVSLVDDGVALVAYPNPCRERVYIQVSEGLMAASDGVVYGWLMDLSGRRMRVRLMDEGDGRYSLDLSGWPEAAYLLSVWSETGKRGTVRVVKKQ